MNAETGQLPGQVEALIKQIEAKVLELEQNGQLLGQLTEQLKQISRRTMTEEEERRLMVAFGNGWQRIGGAVSGSVRRHRAAMTRTVEQVRQLRKLAEEQAAVVLPVVIPKLPDILGQDPLYAPDYFHDVYGEMIDA